MAKTGDENLGVVVHIAVDDIESTLKKVTELVEKLSFLRHSLMPNVTCYKAYFADPNGNMFELWKSINKDSHHLGEIGCNGPPALTNK